MLAMAYGNRSGTQFSLWTEAGTIDFAKVRSIWWRRPQQFQVDPAVQNPTYAQFALNESAEAITGLWQALDVFWINDPARDAIAHRKAHQLRLAREIGLPIPETLITNDPAAARRFIEHQGKAICKAFSATETNWRETRLVGEEELANLDNVRFAPVIFQRYIEAVYDLRITVVGGEIFPAAIYSQDTAYAVDCRIDIGRARIEAVSIPEAVQTQLHELMDALGLVYGAIDMRLQPDGTYVFLEINPAGQFLFIEGVTRQPIARSVAGCLAQRRRATAHSN
jgi:glutathione synthase/RimK-type ligase-like ATP-grasp enzyme